MPTANNQTTLTQVRNHIAAELTNIGRSTWADRFLSGFTAGNVQATIDEIKTFYFEVALEYITQWESYWQDAQDDIWNSLYTAGLNNSLVSDLLSDTDTRSRIVFKAMVQLTAILLMRHRYEVS